MTVAKPNMVKDFMEFIDREKRAHSGTCQTPCSATDILLAAILLGRFSPLALHHVGAIRERLRELNDNELREMVATGKWPNNSITGGE